MSEIFTTPDCDFKPNNWEVHAINHIKCGVKSLTLYKDDKGYSYFRIENLGELFNVKYKGLKDTSAFARVIFENAIIVFCEEDEQFADEHYCRLEYLEDILDELSPIIGDEYASLIKNLKTWIDDNFKDGIDCLTVSNIKNAASAITDKCAAIREIMNVDSKSFSNNSRKIYLELIENLKAELYDAIKNLKNLSSLINQKCGGSSNE